jgi:hypothetical protein
MKIIKKLQTVGNMTLTKKEKQSIIKVAEVWHLWEHLSTRYLVLETTNIHNNYAKDADLKLVLRKGISVLEKQVVRLENLMKEYGIPLPIRNPRISIDPITVETITDRFIFRSVFKGIASMIEKHHEAFMHCNSAIIRSAFLEFIQEEVKLYDMMTEYGKLKNYTVHVPSYRP